MGYVLQHALRPSRDWLRSPNNNNTNNFYNVTAAGASNNNNANNSYGVVFGFPPISASP